MRELVVRAKAYGAWKLGTLIDCADHEEKLESSLGLGVDCYLNQLVPTPALV